MKTKKPTYAQLERTIFELQAGQAYTLSTALRNLPKTSKQHLMASACYITITGVGGKELVPAFEVMDGLNEATIEALRVEIHSTRDLKGFST